MVSSKMSHGKPVDENPQPHGSASSGRSGGVNRRAFLSGATTLAAGAGLASCARGQDNSEAGAAAANKDVSTRLRHATVDFDGPHQAGIATSKQARVAVCAFTVRPNSTIEDMQRLFRLWTMDARRLTQGVPPLGDLEEELSEIPANLTITAGVGERFFDIIGRPDLRPEWLHPIPAFSRDQLDPKWGEADIVLQICADDGLTLAHAMRHMVRSGDRYVTVKWIQQGFSNADGTVTADTTQRNLFGQIDGTVNPHTEEEYEEQVWIDEGPEWMRGGSCMVLRRIAMNIDTWEILDRGSRELSVGRTLDNGAPLTGGDEHSPADFEATDKFGLPVIDPMSHMARSHPPADKPQQKILRRPYSYDLQPEPGSEQLSNSGLLFICFQKNPDEQFTPIQRRLDEGDRLNQWITHIGSSVFFIFPGTTEDDYWGRGLLES
ncbi:Dyp-type peroxidase [Corynebacterium sp. 11A]|uniref:Dyp-type peroxidase n=1 Tax=Corynebacterium sp. 11A TaxID=2080510 RepID=UPI001CEF6D01|nr:Dyp-type peroxidase [Corynebacterium sp. 11A]